MLAPTAAQKIIQQSSLFTLKNGTPDKKIEIAKNNEVKLNQEIIDLSLNDPNGAVRKAWLNRHDYPIPKNMVGRFIFKQNRFERSAFFHHLNSRKEPLTNDQFIAGMNDPFHQCRADCIDLWISLHPQDIPESIILDALEDYSDLVRAVVAEKYWPLSQEQELTLLNDDSARVVLAVLQRASFLGNIGKIDTKQIIDKLIDESQLDKLSSWLKSGAFHFDSVDLLRILATGMEKNKKQAMKDGLLSCFMSSAVDSSYTTINREAAIELRLFFKSMGMEIDIKKTEQRYKAYVAEKKAQQSLEALSVKSTEKEATGKSTAARERPLTQTQF